MSQRLLAVLFPSIYFVSHKKYGMAIVTFALFGLGLILILFVLPTILFWGIATAMAVMHDRQQRTVKLMDQHAQMIADKIHAKNQSPAAASMSASHAPLREPDIQ